MSKETEMAWPEEEDVVAPEAPPSHPGWGWGLLLVPAAVGLSALGVFLSSALAPGAGVLVGVVLIAWAASLVMPFFVIAWYAVQATWKASREAQGRTFAAPSRELRSIGYRIRWSHGARRLMFGPASSDGRDLPMLMAGRIVHGIAIGVLVVAGLIAAFLSFTSR